ncbi:hypothetical protein GCM10027294_21050 [Marinactinospora endophytica]
MTQTAADDVSLLRPVTRGAAGWVARRSLAPARLAWIGLLLCGLSAVWFSEPGPRGALFGSLLLAAAWFADAVGAELGRARRDAFTAWFRAVLRVLREYVVYAGVAAGAVAAGIPGAWTWAAGALIAHALRESVVMSSTASPDGPVLPSRNSEHAVRPATPLDALDPGRPGGRSPSDQSLANEILGAPRPAPPGRNDRETGPGRARSARPRERIRTARARRAIATLPQAPVSADNAGEERPRPRRAAPASSGLLRRIVAFPQTHRFVVIAVTVTVWDGRVTFIALIAGCVLAVVGDLAGTSGHDRTR